MSDSLWPHGLQHARLLCPSLSEFAQTPDHWVNDAILHLPLLLFPHKGLSQWVSSSHQVVKVLELQLQCQSFQWIFRVDFLSDWLVWPPCCLRDSQSVNSNKQVFISLEFSKWQKWIYKYHVLSRSTIERKWS